jgi:hypothetical protein
MDDPLRNVGRAAAFDAATVEIMRRSMELAWSHVVTAGVRFGDDVEAAALRNMLARFIVDAAKGGARSEIDLAQSAIAFVSAGRGLAN